MNDGPLPSTDMQRFFWLLYEGHEGPRPPLHGRQLTLLFGELDADALESSIATALSSHTALTARFEIGDTGLEQSFGHPPPPLGRTDLRAHPAHERDELAAAIVRRTFDDRFDLADGEAPLRVHLVILADDEAVLARTVHHVSFDFRSSQLLSEDIWAHYRARMTGEPAPTRSSDFAEVMAAERALKTAPDVEAKRAFWKEFLAGTAPPRRSKPSPKSVEIELADPLDVVLDDEAKEYGTSRSGVVLTRFARAIASWRQGPQAVGYFTANRRDPRFASTVGCLAQWVPIRIEHRDDETALAASRRHDEAFKQAFAHVLPIGDIGRSAGTPRLFDLMISLMLFPGLKEHALAEGSRAKALATTLAAEARPLTEPFRIGSLEVRELGTAMRSGGSALGLYIMPKRISCEYDESVLSIADARAILERWAAPMARRD